MVPLDSGFAFSPFCVFAILLPIVVHPHGPWAFQRGEGSGTIQGMSTRPKDGNQPMPPSIGPAAREPGSAEKPPPGFELLHTLRDPKGGRPRKWGERLPAPQEHTKWNVPGQVGRAYVYGRVRTFRYKRLRCCWSVSGLGRKGLAGRLSGMGVMPTLGVDMPNLAALGWAWHPTG